MESRNTILSELKEISPVVAQVNAVTPYQVPAGYFEGLTEAILSLVKAEELSPVLQAAKKNPYNVAPGYFESLAGIILNRVKASEASTAKEEIETLSPLLSGLNKKGPYGVPDSYFNELLENVTDGAKAINLVNEELEILSPMMNSLKNKNVYEVPQGYFDGLAADVLNKVKVQQPAKVVSMNFRKRVMRYAAAAIVAALIITGGWFYVNRGAQPGPSSLADIQKVSDEDLQKYVENQPLIDETPVANTASADINEDDMKDMLADVSDEELQQYVEQNGGNTNSVTN